jgi:tRNA dimethylallyltransferase
METLEKKFAKRLEERLRPSEGQGMLDEVKNLHAPKSGVGLSWKRLESFGLEYKFCALHLQKKITREELEQQLYRAIRQYAKRQLTWFKRNKDIKWFQDVKKVQG